MITFSISFEDLYPHIYRQTEYAGRTYVARNESKANKESIEFDDIVATEDDKDFIVSFFNDAYSTLANLLKDYISDSEINASTVTYKIATSGIWKEEALTDSVKNAIESYFVYFAMDSWLKTVGIADFAEHFEKEAGKQVELIKYALSAREKRLVEEKDYELRTDELDFSESDKKTEYAQRSTDLPFNESDKKTEYAQRSTDLPFNESDKTGYTERTEDMMLGDCACKSEIQYSTRTSENIPLFQKDGFYHKKSRFKHGNFNI
jgi:hypothetical protein